MRRALLLLALAGCGVDEASGPPRVPLAVTMDRATADSLGGLQVTLLSPASKYDCGVLVTDCVRNRVSASEPLQLLDSSGTGHPAQRFTLASDPSGQSFEVQGIPPAKSVVVAVEGITKDNKLGASACVLVAEIKAGANAAVPVSLQRKATPKDCDPRFEP